jgi:CheY-like chemotaxis protein
MPRVLVADDDPDVRELVRYKLEQGGHDVRRCRRKPRAGRSDPIVLTVYFRLRLCTGGTMPIYSIWESQFPAAKAAEGRAVTEAIWRDMPCLEGYVSHELLVGADDPGHLLATRVED